MSTVASPPSLRERALQSIAKLPPFSPVLNKLLASLSKGDIMVSELADWIEKDTVLTGNVMRMVNSAAYGRMGTVSSVRHAITILGTNRLRNIVLGLSVCNLLGGLKLPAGWSSKQFNLHGIAVANMSDLVAQNMAIEYGEGAFVGGLLHDVGKLLLAVSCPDEYAAVITEARRDHKELHEVELAQLGFSHAELSLKVLEQWKLPLPIQKAVQLHHSPDRDSATPGQLSLSGGIQIGDFVVNALGIRAVSDTGASGDQSDARVILQALGLGDKADRMIDTFEKDMEALRAVL